MFLILFQRIGGIDWLLFHPFHTTKTDAVGMGSKITVEDQGTKMKEDYHLIFGDAEDFDDGQVTMSSPIGRALLGKKVGEIAVLKLPMGVRKLKVVKLVTIHDDLAS